MSTTGDRPFSNRNEGSTSVTSSGDTPTCDAYEVRMPTPQRAHTRKKQTSLFEYLPIEFQTRYDTIQDNPVDEEWGHTYRTKQPDTVRVWFTNPNGIGINPTGSKSHSTFTFLYRKSRADIVCLAETNLRGPSLKYNA